MIFFLFSVQNAFMVPWKSQTTCKRDDLDKCDERSIWQTTGDQKERNLIKAQKQLFSKLMTDCQLLEIREEVQNKIF